MNISKASVIHPFLFAIFPIISIYSSNLQELLPKDLVQPIIIILAFTVIIFLIAKLIFKVWSKASLMVSLVIGLMFSYGYVYLELVGFAIGDFTIGRHIFLLIPYITAFFGVGYYIFRTKKNFENVTKILNVVSVTLIVVTTVSIGTYAIENNGLGIVVLENNETIQGIDSELSAQEKEMISKVGDLEQYPDVYFLIFDEYAGQSSLKSDLNFDNSKFISNLEDKGFTVIQNSHSNYPQSFLSITSTMNMKYLNYLKDRLGEESKDQLTAMKMMNNFLAMEIFKSKGYKTVSFETTSFEINADYYECESKSVLESNKLMSEISKISIFGYILNWVELENTREKQECYFSELSEVHKKFDEPVFVFGHIIAPHAPNVFGPNGEPVVPRIYYNEWGTEEDKQRYLGTLQYVNLRIDEFIDKVLSETDQKPIIVIQSDHGTAFDFDWNNPTNDMLKQRFSNLNAYYFPKGAELLYDDITPVNSFRIMFNSNFNGNFELLEDKLYWSDSKKPYQFKDVTKLVKEE